MSQEPLNRPPDPSDPAFTQFIYQLWKRVTVAGQVAWSQLTGTPTTLGGYGITDAQPLDSDLTSIASLTGSANQVLGKNNANSAYELKTIAAGTNVTVTHAANTITIASSGGGGGSTVERYYFLETQEDAEVAFTVPGKDATNDYATLFAFAANYG
jgi:hypothetical protein